MSTPPQPGSAPATLRFDWEAHAIFVLCGVANTLLGPLVPDLMTRWSLTHAQIGTFFTCQFLGAVAGNLVSVLLIPRGLLRRTLALGALCMGIGILTLGRSTALAGMASVALYGMGNGLAVPAGNLLIARVPLSRRAGALSFLNFVWGLGAVATSPLLALWASRGDWRWLLAGFAAVLFFLSVRAAMLGDSPATGPATPDQAEIALPPVPPHYWKHIAIMVAAFFLYVPVENSIGGWSATHGHEVGLTLAFSTLMPGIFYGALVGMRGVAPLLFRVVSARRAAEAGLALAAAGFAIFIYLHQPAAMTLALIMMGAGLATVFPTLLAIFAEVAGPRTEKLGPMIFMATNVSASLMLSGIGVLMDRTGSSSQALLLPWASEVLLLCLLLWSIPRPGSATAPRAAN